MSLQSQKKLMGEIAELLSVNLSYVFGDRESGPNGAKQQFLTKSAVFLRALGKDLGFTEMNVRTNKAGIACSGEVTLYGIWSDGNGLMFELTQSCCLPNELMYRRISHMKDYAGGRNKWINTRILWSRDYGQLCSTLLQLKKPEVRHGQSAA